MMLKLLLSNTMNKAFLVSMKSWIALILCLLGIRIECGELGL